MDVREDATAIPADLDVFGDEYEVDEADAISDGFGPGHDRGGERKCAQEDLPTPSVAAHYGPVSPISPQQHPLRSSIRKVRGADNPFVSPDDAVAERSLLRNPSIQSTSSTLYAPGISHRSVSSASSNNYASTNSPNPAGRGPSHPYGMYPQGTIPRSPSVATSSTIRRQQGQSSVREAPAHPYTMYSQGVGEDDVDGEPVSNPLLPVGFPGLAQSYQRRRGPEGEEQDLVGADGHTEQLPPYTRYPDSSDPKMTLLGLPPPLHSRSLVAGTDPGMPLNHDHIQPQSMSDSSQIPSVPAASLLKPEESSPTDSSNTGTKSWSDKSWKQKRNTRVCGIPVWWILLSVCVLLFITAVLAGAIGGVLSAAHQRPRLVTAYTTSLLDASPIATLTARAPPPGTFKLPLSEPTEVFANCITNSQQAAAWSCDLGVAPELALVVTQNATGTTGAFVTYLSDEETVMIGEQPPNTTFSPFLAVHDNDNPGAGPAFYFQAFYDKVVVLDENTFSTGNRRKRDQFNVPQARLMRRQVQIGQKPWFCVWNNTLLEGFIYVTESAVTSKTTPAPSSPSASSSSATPIGTITQAGGLPGASSSIPSNDEDDAADAWNKMSSSPFVVKLEERRVATPNTPNPYCQQMQILNDLSVGIVTLQDGTPHIIVLEETDPAYSAFQSAGIAGKRFKQRDEVAGGCHCQWMSGQ